MAVDKACNGCKAPIKVQRNDDNSGWVVQNPDGSAHDCPARNRGMGGRGSFGKTPAERADIRRMAALKDAVELACAKIAADPGDTRIESKDVVQIARFFVAFLDEGS